MKNTAKDSTFPNTNKQTTTTGGGDGVGVGATTAMRVIVPLQGLVQGGGGLVLGSVIPCALFYFLQLYLKRNRRSGGGGATSSSPQTPPDTHTGPSLQRVQSRSLLSPRGNGPPAHLSSRANAIGKHDGLYYLGLKRVLEDPYDPLTNPNGVIQLGLAENRLSSDLIQEWINEHANEAILGSDLTATYQPLDGLTDLKVAIAEFMSRVTENSVLFNPSQIVVTAGPTPAIELLSFCLADPGNAFLVPSPYYPDLDRDIKWRTGVEIVPVPCRSSDNFNLTLNALERAFNQAKKRGIKIRGIIISNPSNPMGNFLNRDTIYNVLDFATEKNIHVILIESYVSPTRRFIESVDFEWDRDRIHIVYNLANDFSVPDFRTGFIYSFNKNILTALKKMARFSPVSGPTQRLWSIMLTDVKLVERVIETGRERLEVLRVTFMDGLARLGIKCLDNTGGFYCWVDMSRLLRSYSEKGELELWDSFMAVSKINVTPGSFCHCIEPGWFRICFGMLREEDIPVVMERIRKVLETRKVNG